MDKFSYGVVMIVAMSLFSLLTADSPEPEEETSIIEISSEQARHLIDTDSSLVVLDIRTQREYYAGRIGDAIQIDFYNPGFKQQLNELDKTKPYILYCRTGNRTRHSLPIFRQLGFERIYHLTNGITEWHRKGNEIIK